MLFWEWLNDDSKYYVLHYFRSPKIYLQNAVGLSKVSIQDLQLKLECEAAELVGEVSYA